MKHTYLFPLADDERWLWLAARMDGADLFGNPPIHAPDTEWSLSVGISDAIGAARDELHKRLETRERLCIGRHYLIPGSMDEGAQERGRQADETVRLITRELWDAPPFRGDVYTNVYLELKRVAGCGGGRDGWAKAKEFLRMYGSIQPRRVIPVWM